jgi:hypothetical protein
VVAIDGRSDATICVSMRRLFTLCAAPGLAALVVLASAVVASAATPLQEYQRTGHISPCKYSPGQLGGKVPNDVEQYAPEYKSQLEAAARARARGCGGGGGGSSGGGSGGGGAGSGGVGTGGSGGSTGAGARGAIPPGPPVDPTSGAGLEGVPPVKTKAADSAAISAPLLLLLIFGGLALVGVVLALVSRYLGWTPRWLAPAAHAVREAGMRIGTTAAGFTDWARPARSS